MLERILIAGSGGQGIVSLGRLLARAAVETIPYITFFPSYGAEVRGGTCHCQVMLSSEEIASPIAEQFDFSIIMNQQSANKFLPRLAGNGLAVINQTLCKVKSDKRFALIPATEIADQLGNKQSANLVMLGALIARNKLFLPDNAESKIKLSFTDMGQTVIDCNLKAFRTGLSR